MYDGWRKEDPATTKQLPVEADVPELLADSATERDCAVGDLTLVAFYYLLRKGEYIIKGNRNDTKQPVQFKREDIKYFKMNQHPLPEKWGGESFGIGWLFRHADTENGTVAGCYLQGIHSGRVSMLRNWNVERHET
jgi:hypothetical protein